MRVEGVLPSDQERFGWLIRVIELVKWLDGVWGGEVAYRLRAADPSEVDEWNGRERELDTWGWREGISSRASRGDCHDEE